MEWPDQCMWVHVAPVLTTECFFQSSCMRGKFVENHNQVNIFKIKLKNYIAGKCTDIKCIILRVWQMCTFIISTTSIKI